MEIKKKNKLSRVTRKTPKECFQINFVSFNSLLVVTGDREIKKTQQINPQHTFSLCYVYFHALLVRPLIIKQGSCRF